MRNEEMVEVDKVYWLLLLTALKKLSVDKFL